MVLEIIQELQGNTTERSGTQFFLVMSENKRGLVSSLSYLFVRAFRNPRGVEEVYATLKAKGQTTFSLLLRAKLWGAA